ncbi:hypothetical protein JCM1840_000266 [Sporobolomyces johnsonii]
MSDTASTYSVSSTTPLTAGTATAHKSAFRRFFSSSSAGASKPASSSDASYDAFADIMALNARHGHPSVKAHFVKSSPPSTKLKSSVAAPSALAAVPETNPSPPYDAFAEIMRLNARHGHPSVQHDQALDLATSRSPTLNNDTARTEFVFFDGSNRLQQYSLHHRRPPTPQFWHLKPVLEYEEILEWTRRGAGIAGVT